jgi:hypothetical protein
MMENNKRRIVNEVSTKFLLHCLENQNWIYRDMVSIASIIQLIFWNSSYPKFSWSIIYLQGKWNRTSQECDKGFSHIVPQACHL